MKYEVGMLDNDLVLSDSKVCYHDSWSENILIMKYYPNIRLMLTSELNISLHTGQSLIALHTNAKR